MDQPHLLDRLPAPTKVLNGAGHSAALFDTGRIAKDDQQVDIADVALWRCHGNFGEEPPSTPHGAAAGKGGEATCVALCG